MGSLDVFTDMDEYYPGSSLKIGSPKGKRQREIDGTEWDKKPQIHNIKGIPHEFFGTSDLAAALGRKAVTIRKWESLGIIPVPTFTKRSVIDDPRGNRRLYSRAQIEGIIQIAKEEGILYHYNAQIRATRFPQRVADLFRQLQAAA